jgi:hypothetical protein
MIVQTWSHLVYPVRTISLYGYFWRKGLSQIFVLNAFTTELWYYAYPDAIFTPNLKMEADCSFEILVFMCLTYYVKVYVSLIIAVTASEISPLTFKERNVICSA